MQQSGGQKKTQKKRWWGGVQLSLRDEKKKERKEERASTANYMWGMFVSTFNVSNIIAASAPSCHRKKKSTKKKKKKHFIIKSISRPLKWDPGVSLDRRLFQAWNRNPIRVQIWNVHKGAIRRDRFIIQRDGGVTLLRHQSIIFSSAVKSPSCSSSSSLMGRSASTISTLCCRLYFLTGNFEGREPKQHLSTHCKENTVFLEVTCALFR